MRDHRHEYSKTYTGTGDSYNLVIEYVDVARPAGRKVPTDGLLVKYTCEKQFYYTQ